MEKHPITLAYLYMVLPSTLKVEIHAREEGGFWARVKNLPGCYTQADDGLELIDMVNDAVLEYFDVPERLRREVGYYIPSKLKEQLEHRAKEQKSHQQIEEEIRNIIQQQKTLAFSRN